jgi:hypothetical protein
MFAYTTYTCEKRASIFITAKTEIGGAAAQIELRGVAEKR